MMCARKWRFNLDVRCLVVVTDEAIDDENDGALVLDVEALAKYRNDPVRLRMVASVLERNFSGVDDPPLSPPVLESWHDQNRRAHELVLARLAELAAAEDP
jgi:hypothetical protein